jgi:precorrin-6A/cobalt-precorrin-6A reductase
MADRVLILGGTEEARALATALAADARFAPVTALAGRTAAPAALAGEVRVGGFGGADGLAAYLRDGGYAALVDATHPFAARISAHAEAAAAAAGVPRLALVRPAWTATPGDRWIAAADEAAAAVALAGLGLADGATVFLALGRQRVDAFAGMAGLRFLLRTVDPLDPPWPGCRVLVGRGPFAAAAERALLVDERVAALVCRNSGGASGAAKLAAARERGLPVVMIARPPPPAPPCVADVAAALAWLAALPRAASSGG